jgi:hypothetical protein
MVCVEHTIGLEIILDTPDGTPMWREYVESLLFPFGDSISIGAR